MNSKKLPTNNIAILFLTCTFFHVGFVTHWLVVYEIDQPIYFCSELLTYLISVLSRRLLRDIFFSRTVGLKNPCKIGRISRQINHSRTLLILILTFQSSLHSFLLKKCCWYFILNLFSLFLGKGLSKTRRSNFLLLQAKQCDVSIKGQLLYFKSKSKGKLLSIF